MTKKEVFVWTNPAKKAFVKEVMSTCLVLGLPDFSQLFVLECDASSEMIGVVLMQNNHPITFKSWKLRDYKSYCVIYDKEMLTIMHALAKFRPYLVANLFKVKTDQKSLIFFLDQKELNDR